MADGVVPSTTGRRSALIGTALGVALLLVAVVAALLARAGEPVDPDRPGVSAPATPGDDDDVARPPQIPPEAAASAKGAFGVHVGGEDLVPVQEYERAIGIPPGQHAEFVLRYGRGTNRGGWPEWRESILEHLAAFSPLDQPRTLVLAVPMLVSEPAFPGDPRDLGAGVDGAYDAQWTWLGQQLAATFGDRLPDRVLLRPGWESNGNWYRWGVGREEGGPGSFDADRARQYAAYWRRLHGLVMAPVQAAGTDVSWVMNASGGQYRSGAFEASWPGDDVVDVISIDIYQNFAFRSTNDFGEAEEVLSWLEGLAEIHGKLLAIDETSVSWRQVGGRQVGGRDNALWFSSLRRWAEEMVAGKRIHHLVAFEADGAANDLYAVVFPGHPRVFTFPRARADLIASFGGPR